MHIVNCAMYFAYFPFRLLYSVHYTNMHYAVCSILQHYMLLALTRKVCGILSKKLQKLALFKLMSNLSGYLSKQLYFAIFCSFLNILQILHVHVSSR